MKSKVFNVKYAIKRIAQSADNNSMKEDLAIKIDSKNQKMTNFISWQKRIDFKNALIVLSGLNEYKVVTI